MTPEEAHIAAQTRLQELAVQGVAIAWRSLRSYNENDVALFLQIVVPLILAAQRTSAALTNSFLATSVGRQPIGIDVAKVIGAAIRTATPAVIESSQRGGLALTPDAIGVPPEIVYRRPFVTTWAALANEVPWREAVNAGLARAQESAAMDVQNTMRHTLRLVGDNDPVILGYRRVPNHDACEFCKLIAGRRYHTGVLMEVHTHCRCGVEVITAANRDDFTGDRDKDRVVAAQDADIRIIKHGASRETPVVAAIAQHGELGPLLVDGTQHFTGPDELAA